MRAAGALLALFAMIACDAATTETRPLDASMSGGHSGDAEPAGDRTAGEVLDPAGDGSSVLALYPDAAAAVDASGGPGGGPDADLDASGVAPPALACDADAGGDAGLCPPPRSVCADRTLLVYFDKGVCVSGSCTWEKRSVQCDPVIYWHNGACVGSITAPAAQ